MTLLLAAIPGHVLDPAKRPLFLLLIGFVATFVVARLNTRLARAHHGGSGLHMGSIVTPGGLHIHHAIFGIIGMVVAGILVLRRDREPLARIPPSSSAPARRSRSTSSR